MIIKEGGPACCVPLEGSDKHTVCQALVEICELESLCGALPDWEALWDLLN